VLTIGRRIPSGYPTWVDGTSPGPTRARHDGHPPVVVG